MRRGAILGPKPNGRTRLEQVTRRTGSPPLRNVDRASSMRNRLGGVDVIQSGLSPCPDVDATGSSGFEPLRLGLDLGHTQVGSALPLPLHPSQDHPGERLHCSCWGLVTFAFVVNWLEPRREGVRKLIGRVAGDGQT
jgi:hypothetical protein